MKRMGLLLLAAFAAGCKAPQHRKFSPMEGLTAGLRARGQVFDQGPNAFGPARSVGPI